MEVVKEFQSLQVEAIKAKVDSILEISYDTSSESNVCILRLLDNFDRELTSFSINERHMGPQVMEMFDNWKSIFFKYLKEYGRN